MEGTENGFGTRMVRAGHAKICSIGTRQPDGFRQVAPGRLKDGEAVRSYERKSPAERVEVARTWAPGRARPAAAERPQGGVLQAISRSPFGLPRCISCTSWYA